MACRFTRDDRTEVEAEPLLRVHLPALNETIHAARGMGCF